jgi:GT2 family glycosyltransferase
MKFISIITVNYNQPQTTIEFLESVKRHTKLEEVEVILVDNGCSEDYGESFYATYPGLVYIKSEQNLGFAGGNNLAIKASKGEFLLLLNNDTEITFDLIDTLVKEMQANPRIGLISPLIKYFDSPEIIQYAGFTSMNYLTCRNVGIGNMEKDYGQYDQISSETGFCHGAAMMCRKSDLDDVGLMEENYFLYYEELDWCEKFRRSEKKIWFTGKTSIFHKESMSVGKLSDIKTYFMTRNRMLFIRRNTGFLNTLFFSFYYVLIASTRQVLVYIKNGRLDLAKNVFKGIFWNFTNSKNSSSLGFKI